MASAAVEISHRRRQDLEAATLGQDLGRFAFRTWSFPLTAKGQGYGDGARQQCHRPDPDRELIHNPAGYHHNVMHSVTLTVA